MREKSFLKIVFFLLTFSFTFYNSFACVNLNSATSHLKSGDGTNCTYDIVINFNVAASSVSGVNLEIHDPGGTPTMITSYVYPVSGVGTYTYTFLDVPSTCGITLELNGNGVKNNGGSCGNATMNIAVGVPLPVELTFFKVLEKDQSAILKWQTASETNNDYFEIERKGPQDDRFELIAEVWGKGNSNVFTDYQFVDEQVSSGFNYYRLTQVDIDGTRTTFQTVATNIQSLDREMRIIGNVIESELNIVNPNSNHLHNIELYSYSGEKLMSVNSDENISLNISHFSPGLYFLKKGETIIRFYKI